MTATTPGIVSPLPAGLLDGQRLPPRILDVAAGPVSNPHMVSAGPEPIVLGDPGSCPPGGSQTFVIIDSSPSVDDSDGNDPLSRRYDETALAIRHVAEACRCGRDRIALVPFDNGSPGHVAPQPLTPRGVRRLDRGLQRLAATYGMSSQLGPALDRVDTQTVRRGAQTGVVVFSDFLLTDQNPTNVLSRLRAFPGHVHVVVLGALPPGVLVADPNVPSPV
ncbi:VWA domain-containing protein [Mycolicibacterium gilvum]|uniref:VWFA domain-containing protein n=1 Tax=Mycolicibacterium gilvum (strain DSM 45189 / LMG 24558 / Spyr1) TaxID=278137 RepID=E6TKH0_MYCSR|nr:VWA domain-containing protein [Mycolicibacterium gilvum]ADU00385.1 hypothetical protein Mspyr1_37850 [Mycolicibacterium gilvum Spyr1]